MTRAISFLIQAALMALILTLILFKSVPARAEAETTEPAFELTLADAEEAISGMLVEEGLAKHLKVSINSSRKSVLYRFTKPFSVGIKTLKYDGASRKFSANLFFLDGENVLSAMPVSGTFTEMVEVPMLKKTLARGQEINQEDIYMKLLPAARLRSDTVTDAQALMGKTPRRAISQNRPIRKLELASPAVIEKGEMVTMHYKTPYMTISTTGEAQQEGAEGEMIRVKNAESNVTVSATVLADGEVQVGSAAKAVELSQR